MEFAVERTAASSSTLAHVPVLAASDVLQQLEKRIVALDHHLSDGRAEMRRFSTLGLPRLFLIEDEYRIKSS